VQFDCWAKPSRFPFTVEMVVSDLPTTLSMRYLLLKAQRMAATRTESTPLGKPHKCGRILILVQNHYFTVKGNQPGLLEDLEFYFRNRGKPPDVEDTPCDHGRIETRKIWTTTELNRYLNFPHVGQAYVIERHCIDKKTGKYSLEIAYGLTSRTSEQASPQRVLQVNRGHWTIENRCHSILDWNYDEDRSRIRTGYGPENITRLHRFAIGVIKPRGAGSVARNVRLVFDSLRMTENAGARRCRKS
jgi:hypothetical protein